MTGQGVGCGQVSPRKEQERKDFFLGSQPSPDLGCESRGRRKGSAHRASVTKDRSGEPLTSRPAPAEAGHLRPPECRLWGGSCVPKDIRSSPSPQVGGPLRATPALGHRHTGHTLFSRSHSILRRQDWASGSPRPTSSPCRHSTTQYSGALASPAPAASAGGRRPHGPR